MYRHYSVRRFGLFILRGADKFGKFWSACGQQEIKHTERMKRYRYKTVYNMI